MLTRPIAHDFEHSIEDEIDFRRPVLIGLMTFVLLFMIWHTLAESRFGFGSLAFLEGGFALYSAVILYFVIRRPYSRLLAFAFVSPGLMVIIAAMFHPQTPSNVFVWIFLFPILTYALLGRQLGLAITLIASLLALGAYLSKIGDVTQGSNLLVVTDVVVCMGIIWIIAHLYELYRERTVEALRLMAATDELTGLQNRRQMERAFEHLSMVADRQGYKLAVMVIDLDHFKQINDRLGHDAGDAVLVHAAGLLRSTMRKSDWAFRTGGEEFCLLLEIQDYSGAVTAAEAVRSAIEQKPCRYDGETIALTASIGVAIYPEEDSTFEQLLQRADQYMYRAKKSGRNRVVGIAADAAFNT